MFEFRLRPIDGLLPATGAAHQSFARIGLTSPKIRRKNGEMIREMCPELACTTLWYGGDMPVLYGTSLVVHHRISGGQSL